MALPWFQNKRLAGRRRNHWAASALFFLFLSLTPAELTAQPLQKMFEAIKEPGQIAIALFSPISAVREAALMRLVQHGKPDMAAVLITALRFIPGDRARIVAVLKHVTGEDPGDKWFDWMGWQQAHPEVKPFEGFNRF